MKNWLKTKLRQFLCHHSRTELLEKIITERYTYGSHADPLQAKNRVSQLVYCKSTFRCKDCKKIKVHTYRA